MNTYAILVLAALVLDWAVNVLADIFNLKALSPELPAEFEDVYDKDTYRRSQEYTRARTRFGLVPATCELALVLGFWFADGFAWLDGFARGLGFGPIVTGLVFIGALLVLKELVFLPFRLYSTFVIEERFGFNRTTAATFWTDALKGLALGALLGGPLLAAVLYFFESAGASAWVWCWLATSAFVLVLQFVAPTWIFPLFNRFEPLEDGELKAAILAYAGRVGFPLEDLFVIDGSRRSSKGNAFFTGFGKTKRVALFDTLIEKHEVPELVAVVAHEIGHFKKKHITKGIVLSILHLGALFWLLSLFLTQDGLFAAFGIEGRPVYAGLVFFGLLYTPIELVLGLALQALSRKHELEADRFAAETTGEPEQLAIALRRLSALSLSNLTPHPFYVALNHSHPPLVERIGALRALSPSASTSEASG
jgi:STE24 endopeptidase